MYLKHNLFLQITDSNEMSKEETIHNHVSKTKANLKNHLKGWKATIVEFKGFKGDAEDFVKRFSTNINTNDKNNNDDENNNNDKNDKTGKKDKKDKKCTRKGDYFKGAMINNGNNGISEDSHSLNNGWIYKYFDSLNPNKKQKLSDLPL